MAFQSPSARSQGYTSTTLYQPYTLVGYFSGTPAVGKACSAIREHVLDLGEGLSSAPAVQREICALLTLRHENLLTETVVGAHASDQPPNNCTTITLRLRTNPPVLATLRERIQTFTTHLHISWAMGQILQGLEYLQSKAIIHGVSINSIPFNLSGNYNLPYQNLNPDNCVIAMRSLKLANFARLDLYNNFPDSALSTPADLPYRAPELLLGIRSKCGTSREFHFLPHSSFKSAR